MIGARNGTGTAALAVAVLALALSWSVVGGVVCGVVAFALGFVGRGRAVRGEANNSEIATAGIALGFVGVVASLAFAVIWLYAWRDSGGDAYLDCAVRAGNDQRAVQACTDGWLDQFKGTFGVTSKTQQGQTRGST
jgi:hypothetical protein